jgi:Pectinacetylesterase
MSVAKYLICWMIVALLILCAGCAGESTSTEDQGDDDDSDDDDDDYASVDDDDSDDDSDDDDTGPLTVGEWEWVNIQGAVCRDGTPTGIGVRLAENSDKLAIYLEATGICAFADQCEDELGHFEEETFYEMIDGEEYLYSGLFNSKHNENPLRDWNFVYVPGCTGDMFAGNNPNGIVVGLPGQHHFVGFTNMELITTRLSKIFDREMERVALWGECSGGNGALITYPLVAEAFSPAPVSLLDDSGPIAEDDDAFAPCMQKMLRSWFLIDEGLPDDCPECSLPNGDGLAAMQPYLANTYPQGNFGMLMSLEDYDIRMAWGFGQDNCTRYFTAETEEEQLLPEGVLTDSLYDLRDNHLLTAGRWSTFYADGDFHTFVMADDEMFEYDEWFGEDFVLVDWVRDIVNGDVPDPFECGWIDL